MWIVYEQIQMGNFKHSGEKHFNILISDLKIITELNEVFTGLKYKLGKQFITN